MSAGAVTGLAAVILLALLYQVWRTRMTMEMVMFLLSGGCQ